VLSRTLLRARSESAIFYSCVPRGRVTASVAERPSLLEAIGVLARGARVASVVSGARLVEVEEDRLERACLAGGGRLVPARLTILRRLLVLRAVGLRPCRAFLLPQTALHALGARSGIGPATRRPCSEWRCILPPDNPPCSCVAGYCTSHVPECTALSERHSLRVATLLTIPSDSEFRLVQSLSVSTDGSLPLHPVQRHGSGDEQLQHPEACRLHGFPFFP